MEVFNDPAAMSAWSDQHRVAGRRVAVVPTMGALHEGHVALITDARRRADVVILSLFVNPLQFEREDDFSAYPRRMEDDLATCRANGVDAVYAPSGATMYPPGFQTHVLPGAIADVLEGEQRPGHFRGVTTVVTKLFGATRPHLAIFGEKDFQQLAVIRRMNDDLNYGIEIVGHPTVREADGVALSSRNRRLDPEQRRAATCVPRSLDAVATLLASGSRDAATLIDAGRAVVQAEPLARLEHLELVDPTLLLPVALVEGPTIAVTAVWFGDVRLIDNRMLSPAASTGE